MKKQGLLIDTSVWIEFFRGDPSVRDLIGGWASEDRIFTAGPILYELMQGIRLRGERVAVKEALLSTRYLDLTSEDWEEAGALSRELRAGGLTLPMTDLLVGQLARTRHLMVVSHDSHFESIPGIPFKKMPLTARSHR